MAYLKALIHRGRSGAALLAMLMAAVAPAVQAQATPEPVQVGPRAWYVQGESALGSPQNRNFISNAGFVATDDGVVAIDALGSPQLAREFIAAVRRVTGQSVTHVIVTHYHADHIYGLQEFRRAGARILAHRGAQDYLNSDLARSRLQASRTDLAPWVDAQTELVPADEWIDGPRELVVGGVRFMLMPVGPAHTPEDLAVFVPSQKVLYAGDLVFRGRVPFVGQARSGEWIHALTRLLALDADAVVPGHGAVTRDARADMALTRDYLAYLRQTMGAAARAMEPFDEAYARVDWSRFEHLALFRAANRMNAYNTYLLMEHEAP